MLRSFLILAALCVAMPAATRAGKSVPAAGAVHPGTDRPSDFGAVPEPESGTIERIRQEGEAVLTGTHWTYDPAGRRDPFRSLVERVKIAGEEVRPPGIAGMLIGEIDLIGIVNSPSGSIAFLNGTDNRGYFMRRGDKLFDGKIVDIDRAAGQVVFRQKVDDPREIKPYRDVIKTLYSAMEEGR
ncbi:MAG: hypothetical protein ACE5IK_12225 [Acidobacteriota bacterium]